MVFFVHDDAISKLVVGHASGEHADLVTSLRLGLGERLTGWVGATRRTICNSDAALDFVGMEGPRAPLQELPGRSPGDRRCP